MTYLREHHHPDIPYLKSLQGSRGDCGGCYEICGGGSIGGMPFGLETLRYIKMLGLLNSHQHFDEFITKYGYNKNREKNVFMH